MQSLYQALDDSFRDTIGYVEVRLPPPELISQVKNGLSNESIHKEI